MPSTQEFRRRMKSIENTKQITGAMERVASVKMQRAVSAILSARSYVQNSWNMLLTLSKMKCGKCHPLMRKAKKINKGLLLIATSDRGLCGTFNSDLIKKANAFLNGEEPTFKKEKGVVYDFISIGKKGSEIGKIAKSGKLLAEFSGLEKDLSPSDISGIAKLLSRSYLKKEYDEVLFVYSHFESSLKQTPTIKRILPISKKHVSLPKLWEEDWQEEKIEFKIEPEAEKILQVVVPKLLLMQIYGAILESNASEHAARMVAMKNATDNAENLIDELRLAYNTVRQNSITSEIAEISSAAEAMK